MCVAVKEGKVNVVSAESRKILKRHRYSTCLRSLFFKKNLFDSGKKKFSNHTQEGYGWRRCLSTLPWPPALASSPRGFGSNKGCVGVMAQKTNMVHVYGRVVQK